MGRKAKAAILRLAESQTESLNQSVAVKRRSGRLEKLNPPSQNGEIGAIIEINDNGNEKLTPPSQDGEPIAEPISGLNAEENLLPAKKTLGEKIDDIVHAVEELNAKASRSDPQDQDDVPTSDINYQSLYFDSQLKIEALMKENHELSRKAEVAVAKMEAYADVTRVWSDVLGQMKEVFMFANQPEATKKTTPAKVGQASGTKATKKPSPTKGVEANGATEPQTSAKRKKTTKTNQQITEENGALVPLSAFKKNKKAKKN